MYKYLQVSNFCCLLLPKYIAPKNFLHSYITAFTLQLLYAYSFITITHHFTKKLPNLLQNPDFISRVSCNNPSKQKQILNFSTKPKWPNTINILFCPWKKWKREMGYQKEENHVEYDFEKKWVHSAQWAASHRSRGFWCYSAKRFFEKKARVSPRNQ